MKRVERAATANADGSPERMDDRRLAAVPALESRATSSVKKPQPWAVSHPANVLLPVWDWPARTIARPSRLDGRGVDGDQRMG